MKHHARSKSLLLVLEPLLEGPWPWFSYGFLLEKLSEEQGKNLWSLLLAVITAIDDGRAVNEGKEIRITPLGRKWFSDMNRDRRNSTPQVPC